MLIFIIRHFCLSQVVDHPIHFCNGSLNSLIDLAFLSNQQSLSYCNIIPPLSNPDHLGVKLQLKLKVFSTDSKHHSCCLLWKYARADWERAHELICACDQNALFAWMNWQHTFLSIMEKAISKDELSFKRNVPWFSVEIKKAIKKRNRLFKKEDMSSRFRMARNRVTSLIRKAKHQYFHHIVSSDSKMFWRSVRAINKKQSSIPVLECNGVIQDSDEKKAVALNSFFLSCFNLSFTPPNPSTTQ